MKNSGTLCLFAQISESHVAFISGESVMRNQIFPTLAMAILLSPAFARAANLLANPSFEANPGVQAIPNNWTYFTAPNLPPGTKDYWIVPPASDSCSPHFPAHDGSYVWKQWFVHNGTNNVAGLYQTYNSSPGAIYQASGW